MSTLLSYFAEISVANIQTFDIMQSTKMARKQDFLELFLTLLVKYGKTTEIQVSLNDC